ncbi:MAG TPA: hypothetical protein VFV17_01910 [Usitatibacteraceae bacterium]|nr:hypothetical protein [Usitatibacteraceae bacterium]
MNVSDEKLLEMATRLAAGDAQYYIAMERRSRDRPDAADLALASTLLIEHFCVVREAAARIKEGVITKAPYDAAEAKRLEWSPG